MGRKWGTRKKTSKVDWNEVDIPKMLYGITCVGLVVAAIIYAIVTGSAPENSGF